ncbi:proline-rich transmembrane protein 4 [Cinclus cinclus]|uniref:proline-rich transmembrane protein 4 n=1 Tax=Cinclus cinclus TaxID=127875 RepID=UPI002E0EE0E5
MFLMSLVGGAAAPRLLLALLWMAGPAAAPRPPSSPPGTPPGPPAPHSESPVLSLNLGLNFKIKVRSQGGPRPPAPPTPPEPPRSAAPPTLPDPGDEQGSAGPPEEAGGWGGPPGRGVTTPPQGRPRDKQLELDIAIDLTAGLDSPLAGSGAAVPPTTLLGGPSGRPRFLPGLSKLAGRLSAAGFLFPTVAPKIDGEGGNASLELDEAGSGVEPALSPGRQPSRGAAPPPAAASACTPGSACDSGGPDTGGASPAPPFSWPPHFLPLGTPWPEAAALWGAAWGGHVYGVGAALALLGGLGVLLLLGGGRPPLARLLGGLLAVSGFARAFPLFFDPYELEGRLPPAAARALFELPFPCLGWGLALAPPARGAPLLLALGVLHLGGALGVVGAVAALGGPPALLLLPRALFAALAAALAVGGLRRCAGRGKRGGLGGARVGVPRLVGAAGAALSAGLQLFGALQAWGWVVTPPPGPWAWWGLQLAARLAEVAMGGALAALAFADTPSGRAPTDGPPEPPEGGGGGRGAVEEAGGSPESPLDVDGDPTAGYRPPSPIDLRRSIDEALGAPGMFRAGNGSIGGHGGTGSTGSTGLAAPGRAGSSGKSKSNGISVPGSTGNTEISVISNAGSSGNTRDTENIGTSTTALPGGGTTAIPGVGTARAAGTGGAGTSPDGGDPASPGGGDGRSPGSDAIDLPGTHPHVLETPSVDDNLRMPSVPPQLPETPKYGADNDLGTPPLQAASKSLRPPNRGDNLSPPISSRPPSAGDNLGSPPKLTPSPRDPEVLVPIWPPPPPNSLRPPNTVRLQYGTREGAPVPGTVCLKGLSTSFPQGPPM